MLQDYLDILGIKRGFDRKSLKKAFRRKAMEHHPDRNNKTDTQKFTELKKAYEYLCNHLNRFSVADLEEPDEELCSCPEKTYEEYLAEKEDEEKKARAFAQKKFELFVSKYSHYRLKWYYYPFKQLVLSSIFLLKLMRTLLILRLFLVLFSDTAGF